MSQHLGQKTACKTGLESVVLAFMRHLKERLHMPDQPSPEAAKQNQVSRSLLVKMPKKVLAQMVVEVKEMVGTRLMPEDPDVDVPP